MKPSVRKLIRWVNRNSIPLSSGLIVGTLVFWVCLERLGRVASIHQPRVLVVVRRLPAGVPVHWRDLKTEVRDQVESAVLTDQDLSFVQGKLLALPLEPGMVLRREMFQPKPRLSERVPRGFRAYPLSIPRQAQIVSGDRVDVMHTPGAGPAIATVVLEGANVLERRRLSENSDELIVSVRKERVSTLEQSRRNGSLTVILRNRYDMSRSKQGKPVKAPQKRTKRKIEVILGG